MIFAAVQPALFYPWMVLNFDYSFNFAVDGLTPSIFIFAARKTVGVLTTQPWNVRFPIRIESVTQLFLNFSWLEIKATNSLTELTTANLKCRWFECLGVRAVCGKLWFGWVDTVLINMASDVIPRKGNRLTMLVTTHPCSVILGPLN